MLPVLLHLSNPDVVVQTLLAHSCQPTLSKFELFEKSLVVTCTAVLQEPGSCLETSTLPFDLNPQLKNPKDRCDCYSSTG